MEAALFFDSGSNRQRAAAKETQSEVEIFISG